MTVEYVVLLQESIMRAAKDVWQGERGERTSGNDSDDEVAAFPQRNGSSADVIQLWHRGFQVPCLGICTAARG